MCVSLSVCVSVKLRVSVCLSECVSLSVCVSVSQCVSVSVCVSLSVCVCVSECVSQYVCLYVVSLFLCLSLSVSICVSVCLSECVSLSVCVFVSLSVCVSLTVCVSCSLMVWVSVSVCGHVLSVCVCLFLSVCLCLCFPVWGVPFCVRCVSVNEELQLQEVETWLTLEKHSFTAGRSREAPWAEPTDPGGLLLSCIFFSPYSNQILEAASLLFQPVSIIIPSQMLPLSRCPLPSPTPPKKKSLMQLSLLG